MFLFPYEAGGGRSGGMPPPFTIPQLAAAMIVSKLCEDCHRGERLCWNGYRRQAQGHAAAAGAENPPRENDREVANRLAHRAETIDGISSIQ
jgi:hypothetical protein